MPIVGVTGKRALKPFLKPMECTIRNTTLTHEFLYMPECTLPLLGHNLLCKLKAQLKFSDKSIQLHVLEETARKAQLCLLTEKKQEGTGISEEILDAVIPLVWASKKPG